MKSQITIPEKFRGPPNSGNGGYVGGAFADLLNTTNPVEVTLRSPIPLDKPMDIIHTSGGEGPERVTVQDGDTLIAEVRESELRMEIPDTPERQAVINAAPSSPSLAMRENPLIPGARGFHPICFCCGADHEDGLRVFTAPIADTNQVAAIWQTHAEWGDDKGHLPNTFLWTALDCPGQFAWYATGIFTGMLGRITAEVMTPAPAGQAYLVMAWPIEIDGKKHFAGSAIFDENDNLIARAKSVWIGNRDIDTKPPQS